MIVLAGILMLGSCKGTKNDTETVESEVVQADSIDLSVIEEETQ